jgi:hypothetical protein
MRRHALALLAGLACPARLPAWANVPKLEDLTECPVFLEMPGVESRALEPTSRRHTGGNRILIFSPIGPISIRQVVSRAGEHLLKRSFAAFGRKSLPDNLVLKHCQYAQKIQSPFGIRVVCKANGELLDADQCGPGNPHALPPEKAGRMRKAAPGFSAMRVLEAYQTQIRGRR